MHKKCFYWNARSFKNSLPAKNFRIYIDDIFNAFQIASGQGYYKSRMKAILDYFAKHALIIIQYPDKKVVLQDLENLENCFQNHDRGFKIMNL